MKETKFMIKNSKFEKLIQSIAVCLVLLPAIASSQSLVASYPFNGNANEATGNQLNGIITNATFDTDRFGVSNSSIRFVNQTTSCVGVTNFASVVLSNQLTVSLWAKFNQSWGFHEESLLWRGSSPNETILMAVNQDSSLYGSGNYDASFTVGSTGMFLATARSTFMLME
jgi:hypothetical protein